MMGLKTSNCLPSDSVTASVPELLFGSVVGVTGVHVIGPNRFPGILNADKTIVAVLFMLVAAQLSK